MIAAGTDFSPGSRHAVAWALAEGRLRRDRVLALHAGPPTSDLVEHTMLVEQRHAATFARLTALLGELGGGNAAIDVVDGDAATVLAERSRGATLLVVGRRGLGAVASALLGSVSHELARHAACPVAVVPEDAPFDVRRVVVGVDGSAGSAAAASWAADEAAARGVPLVERTVDAVEPAGAGEALVETAGEDDLLVVGTRGRGAAARLLLGSTAAYCLEHGAGTVVVVPPRR